MYLQIAPRGRGNQAGTNRAREVRSSHASVGIVSTTRRTSCACRACSETCPADAIAYLYSPCALELIRAAEWVEHYWMPVLTFAKTDDSSYFSKDLAEEAAFGPPALGDPLSSSRAAAHIPTFLSKRTSSIRSPDLNTAMVSSMSIACCLNARSIRRRPVSVR